MAVGRDGGVTSFGAGWPGDVLRRLVGARGKWTPPDRFADHVQAVAELRPQFPWEFWQARWVRGACHLLAPAGAAQNSVIDISLPAGTGRYALFHNFELFGQTPVYLCVNRTFVNPTTGAGVLDGRAIASTGSWLTPMIAGMAAGLLGGLPPAADRVWLAGAQAGGSGPTLTKIPPILLAPGQTVSFVGSQVNLSLDVSAEVWEIPATDIDG